MYPMHEDLGKVMPMSVWFILFYSTLYFIFGFAPSMPVINPIYIILCLATIISNTKTHKEMIQACEECVETNELED